MPGPGPVTGETEKAACYTTEDWREFLFLKYLTREMREMREMVTDHD